MKLETGIFLYFGLPRSGKSCHAVLQAKKYIKNGIPVYSNFPIKGCYLIDDRDIGKYLFENCLIIIDEAGISYDNRKMALSTDANYFYKFHGHYNCRVLFYSQSTDIDVKIRRLAVCHYEIKKSLIPHFSRCHTISRKIGIDEMSHQEVEMFYYVPWFLGGVRYFWRRPSYKLFDTHIRKELPKKDYELVPPLETIDRKTYVMQICSKLRFKTLSSVFYLRSIFILLHKKLRNHFFPSNKNSKNVRE